MKVADATNLFLQLAKGYFEGYMVIYAKQSRTPKPDIPLVTLTLGNVSRQLAPTNVINGGDIVGYYQSRIPIIIDLFTNGEPIIEDGSVVAYSNTALDEILGFADYINSPEIVDWCRDNNISLLLEGEAQDITGLVNDTNYEYRSRMEAGLSFTHKAASGTRHTGYFTEAAPAEEP
jgi:hypothetical protein